MAAEKEKKEKGFRIKPVHIVALAVAIVAIIAVVYMAIGSSSAQVVAVGDNISVYYTGTLTNGTVFDSNVGKQPLNFTVGSGELIKGFDQGVVGMRLNESKNITIPAAEAYGAVNQSLIVQAPLSDFGNSTPSVGMTVSTSQGQRGIVKAVTANSVTVDFNNPLAGQTLIFQIKVIKISK